MPEILHINKFFAHGGAGIAGTRLANALRNYGTNHYDLLVETLPKKEDGVLAYSYGRSGKYSSLMRLAEEKLIFLMYQQSSSLRFQYSMANTGVDISRHSLIRSADLFHLHWICQGFLSLYQLNKLFHIGKPVVWTLHDMWPFTGGCHYTGLCERYTDSCGNCPFLKSPSLKDISVRQYIKKQAIYHSSQITFVSCSNWMASKARSASLLKNIPIEVIPNPIDTTVFRPCPKGQARQYLGLPEDRYLILFGAANLGEKRKGFRYLMDALYRLKEVNPLLTDKIGLVTFGKLKDGITLPFPLFHLHYVSEGKDIVRIYNASDVFVLPSLEDNLPNTVMEAMACGVPSVAFRSGGVTDMIDHQRNGYLANLMDKEDLARGILWIYDHKDDKSLQAECVKKVETHFHPKLIASQYEELYRKILGL